MVVYQEWVLTYVTDSGMTRRKVFMAVTEKDAREHLPTQYRKSAKCEKMHEKTGDVFVKPHPDGDQGRLVEPQPQSEKQADAPPPKVQRKGGLPPLPPIVPFDPDA